MIRKGRYAYRARISSKQSHQILRYRAFGLMASQMAFVTGLNRNVVIGL